MIDMVLGGCVHLYLCVQMCDATSVGASRLMKNLYVIKRVSVGLINIPELQRVNGKYAFFDINAPVYRPLAVYYDDGYPSDEWIEKCENMYCSAMCYNYYMGMYNKYKG